MTSNEYQRLALTKMADQRVIRDRTAALDERATQLDNGSRGIAEEAGEVLACVKRHLEYGKPLDAPRILDECGDVLWRVAQTLAALDYTIEEAMEANLSKLGVRYQAGFTETEAADENRNRTAESKAVVHSVFRPGDRVYFAGPHSQMTVNESVHLPIGTKGVIIDRPEWGGCAWDGRYVWVEFAPEHILLLDKKLLGFVRDTTPGTPPETDAQEGE